MKLAKSILVAAGLALAVGGAYAADKQAKADPEPGFNNMDANNDGKLTRKEAAKDKSLLGKWKEADRNGDGALTRAEYLLVKGKKDVGTAADKVKSAVGSDDKKASTGSTSSSGSTTKSK
ncbi:MAG: hypothetical protein ACREUN_06080 [Burkholderiales bacterium]